MTANDELTDPNIVPKMNSDAQLGQAVNRPAIDANEPNSMLADLFLCSSCLLLSPLANEKEDSITLKPTSPETTTSIRIFIGISIIPKLLVK
jgi:hypothetical protein